MKNSRLRCFVPLFLLCTWFYSIDDWLHADPDPFVSSSRAVSASDHGPSLGSVMELSCIGTDRKAAAAFITFARCDRGVRQDTGKW